MHNIFANVDMYCELVACFVLQVILHINNVDTMLMNRNKRDISVSVLGSPCVFTNSCSTFDANSICGNELKCICRFNHYPETNSNGSEVCAEVAATNDGNSSLWALVSAIGGLLTFGGLICLALRLHSSGRLIEPRGHYANAGAPSVILTDTGTGTSSRKTSRASRTSSVSHQGGSRRASYTMLAPPSRTGSRRTSTASLRSQSSFRGHQSSFRSNQSSFRGHHSSFRDNRRKASVRRTASSPVGPRSPYKRRIMSHEVLTLNCDDLKPGPSKFGSEEKIGNYLSVQSSHEI